MTQDEFRKETHNILARFVEETKEDESDITGSVKATVVQFIMNTKRALNIMSKINGGYVTPADIIEAQVQELRRCVIDLTQHEDFKTTRRNGYND